MTIDSLTSAVPQPFRAVARQAEDTSPAGGRGVIISLGWAVAICGAIAAVGAPAVYRTWSTQDEARQAEVRLGHAHASVRSAAPLGLLPVDEAVAGREVFATTCAACHGPEGKGVPGLGRDLTTSNFVAYLDDEAMVRFIIQGRPTAKPMPMPPRAGRDDLTENQIRRVVGYVRGLQDPRRMPALPALVLTPTPTAEQQKSALAIAGGDAELAKYIASGNSIFHTSCVACHGKGGVGMAGNGKPLVNNPFVQSLDDDALLAFIKAGRSPTDPKSTTGIQMPPKGGNPAMSDDDILDVIAYVRTLQPPTPK